MNFANRVIMSLCPSPSRWPRRHVDAGTQKLNGEIQTDKHTKRDTKTDGDKYEEKTRAVSLASHGTAMGMKR